MRISLALSGPPGSRRAAPARAILLAALLVLAASPAAATITPGSAREDTAAAFAKALGEHWASRCPRAAEADTAPRPVPLTPALEAERALYLQGVCEEVAGRPDRARTLYEQGLAQATVAAALWELALMRVDMAAGDDSGAVSHMIELLAADPAEGYRAGVRELLLQRLDPPGEMDPELLFEYLSAYLAYTGPTPDDYPLLERLYALAREFQRPELLHALPMLMWRNPEDEQAAKRWAGLPQAAEPPAIAGADLLARAEQLYRLRLFDRLASELERTDLPDLDDGTAKALGRLYFRALIRERKLSRAAVQAHTAPFVRRFSFDKRQTLIWQARIQLRRNKVGPALKLIEDLEALDPRDPELPALSYLVADYNRRRGNAVTLRYWCERIVQRYPGTPEASEAYWLMIWSAYRANDLDEAERWLGQAIAGSGKFHPVDQARLYYWKGRMQMDRGDRTGGRATWQTLRERWPYGYYAALSEQMQAGDPLALEGGGIGLDGAEPERPILLALWQVPPFPEALFLFSVGEVEPARDLLSGVLSRSLPDDAVEEAGALFHYLNQHYLQLRLIANHELDELRQHRPSGSSLWQRAFPRPHWPVVATAAAEAKIDPYFVLAVMREESRFYTTADSRVGAKGLMQLMPATARFMAKLRGESVEEDHLHLPETNISLGAAYLKRVLHRFDENPVYAAAAYNAGPGNVRRWLRSFGDLPLDRFVEEIPFRETQNYVKRVFLSYYVYTRLYR